MSHELVKWFPLDWLASSACTYVQHRIMKVKKGVYCVRLHFVAEITEVANGDVQNDASS